MTPQQQVWLTIYSAAILTDADQFAYHSADIANKAVEHFNKQFDIDAPMPSVPTSLTISREDAIKVIDRATDRDDPFWENIVENYDNDHMITIYDVMNALGVSTMEYRKVVGKNQ